MFIEPLKFPNQAPYPEFDEDDELFENEFSVSSASECTGLIPSSPVEESDIESYRDIYSIPFNNSRKKEEKK